MCWRKYSMHNMCIIYQYMWKNISIYLCKSKTVKTMQFFFHPQYMGDNLIYNPSKWRTLGSHGSFKFFPYQRPCCQAAASHAWWVQMWRTPSSVRRRSRYCMRAWTRASTKIHMEDTKSLEVWFRWFCFAKRAGFWIPALKNSGMYCCGLAFANRRNRFLRMLETLLSLVRNDWNVFPTTSFPPFAACNLTEVPPGLADDLPWVLVAFVHLDGNLRVYMIYTIYTHSHIVPIFHIFLPWLEKRHRFSQALWTNRATGNSPP